MPAMMWARILLVRDVFGRSLAVAALGYFFGGADKLSRPDSLSLDATMEAIYRYTGLGWVTGVSYVGISPDPVEMSDGSSYSGLDLFGRVIETLWKKGPDVMQKASYGYDRASNRKWRREDLAHDLGGTQATRHDNFYHYDGLDQVIGRELGELVGTPPNYTGITGAIQDESWSYDATGNWLKYDSAAEANLQQTRCHNAANEITRVTHPGGVIQPAYDEVGNQTLDIAPGNWDRGFSLKWDAWNRLIEVKDGNTLIQTNAYDGLSRRITSGDGTDITHYYYNDAWRSVEEYTDADPDDPACRYLWGLRSRWDLVKRERSDSGTLDEKRYVLYDAMDPVAICDEDGEVVQRFEYSPFGRTTFLSPAFVPVTPTEDWTFLFHGEFRDGDTGYYNYGFRFYNDTTGRWPSRDPIGMRGGLNLYDFVRNSSTRKIDILGLDGGLPGGWSAAIERLGDWITGDHDPSTVYGPDTLESRELSGSATVAKLRKFFREKNQYACPAGVTNYKEEFRPWKANFEQDLDNGTVHFVGSFSAEISLLSVMKMDTFAGSDGFIYTRFLMTVRYKLTNTVSIESLFRFLDGGTRLIVDDSWNIEDNTRNEFIPGDGGTGGSYLSMFSNWHQTFWWVEHDTCLRKHKMSSCTASYKDHEQPVKPYDVNDIIKP